MLESSGCYIFSISVAKNSQKVLAENCVLFESSRGLIFLTTTITKIVQVPLVTKINTFMYIETFNAVEILPPGYL